MNEFEKYILLKEQSKILSNFLIDSEINFKHEIDTYENSIASYFEIKAVNNKIITCVITLNGYVFFKIGRLE